MTTYSAPINDNLFLLNDVFDIAQYGDLPVFTDLTPDIVKAILTEAGKFAEEIAQPLNRVGDSEGCVFDNGAVSTPAGFRQAYRLLRQNGWTGLIAQSEYGGQGLPRVINAAFIEYLGSANMAFALYPGLSLGAYEAIQLHASDELKDIYLPMLANGKWTGTMNLTEPHCGTDLGLLRTRAAPDKAGTYAISGTKIFISAGEHDLAENIVHLVLARIEGAPEGTKGISLFIVPKKLTPGGEANGVSCGSIEHKMGIHGNATCVMNFDNARGWLIGEENGGLRAMFTFMNEARLAVGLQGLAASEVAYQNAAAYARTRLQGRSISGVKAPESEADPIIVHPDVRRMLMNMRAFNEAARALITWTALRASVAIYSSDKKQRQRAEDHMALITPVIKGVLTDTGFANTVTAQQVFGGAGYITETGMEQFVRDARIAMIYEGTNGIQALDLVGRKLADNGGRALMGLFGEIDDFLRQNDGDTALAAFTAPLKTARDDLEKATGWLMSNAMKKPDNAGAAANDYMHLMGLVVLGFMWGLMAKTASDKLGSGEGDKAFYENKLITGRYFMQRIIPETAAHLARITAGADSMMALPAEAF